MAERAKTGKTTKKKKSSGGPSPAKARSSKKASTAKRASPAKRATAAKKATAPKAATASPAPKLPGWMADHLERYLSTNGADGHLWRGVPTLLLTTIGSQSGEPRLLPLIYGRDGARYLVVASRGGAPDHPAWYKNLLANPDVEVQVGSDRFRARARPANRDERPRLWRTMTRIWPAYDQYQSRTQREIPVVLLERR